PAPDLRTEEVISMRAVRTCVVDCPQETWWYHRQRSGLPDHHVLVQNDPDIRPSDSDVIAVSRADSITTKYVPFNTFFRGYKCAYAHKAHFDGLTARQSRPAVKQSTGKPAKLPAKSYRHCFFGC
ncbi:hypothetical protein PQR34_45820, partial [Paraburkholderia sediminicola]|uniref:hypothetical protein n=1 Tax=Paraburkholderia sediminicola TaxID=458836 RepID=UPI0038BD131D